MLTGTHSWIRSWATCRCWLVLIALCVGCICAFYLWREPTLEQYLVGVSSAEDKVVLDARMEGYTPEEVHRYLEHLGREGRHFYAITELTLDLLFPLVYGALLAVMIAKLFPPCWARWLILIPLIAALADLTENSLFAYLAWTFDNRPSDVAQIARIATSVKAGGISLALLLSVGASLTRHMCGDCPRKGSNHEAHST